MFFKKSGVDTWSEESKLRASDAAGSDAFGGFIAKDGNTIIIGALGNDDNGSNSGSVYFFNRLDTTLPTITLTVANPQEINEGSTYTELGATANDDTDGDISGNIFIDATNVNTAVAGSYSVTYNVVDAAGNNAVQVTRTVNVRPIVPVPLDDSETVDKNSTNNIFTVLSNDDFGGNEAHAQ